MCHDAVTAAKRSGHLAVSTPSFLMADDDRPSFRDDDEDDDMFEFDHHPPLVGTICAVALVILALRCCCCRRRRRGRCGGCRRHAGLARQDAAANPAHATPVHEGIVVGQPVSHVDPPHATASDDEDAGVMYIPRGAGYSTQRLTPV